MIDKWWAIFETDQWSSAGEKKPHTFTSLLCTCTSMCACSSSVCSIRIPVQIRCSIRISSLENKMSNGNSGLDVSFFKCVMAKSSSPKDYSKNKLKALNKKGFIPSLCVLNCSEDKMRWGINYLLWTLNWSPIFLIATQTVLTKCCCYDFFFTCCCLIPKL